MNEAKMEETLDAVEFLGGNCPEVQQHPWWQWPVRGRFYVQTFRGRERIDPGDYVVNDIDGGRRPIKRDVYRSFVKMGGGEL